MNTMQTSARQLQLRSCPLSTVVCCKCYGEEAILADLEGIPANTAVSLLNVRTAALLLGPEDVSFWQCMLEPAQLFDILIQREVGP